MWAQNLPGTAAISGGCDHALNMASSLLLSHVSTSDSACNSWLQHALWAFVENVRVNLNLTST